MDRNVNVLPEGVLLTPVKVIQNVNGDILHALKATDESFASFGEAYFSIIGFGKIKGWKRHTRMILNLIVPVGQIRFVLFDDRQQNAVPVIAQVTLSRENYQRLTVPPGIWMAFQGVGKQENMLLNIASIPHDPLEAENLPLENNRIKFNWL